MAAAEGKEAMTDGMPVEMGPGEMFTLPAPIRN
jgi:hypothetical protein